MSTRMPKNVYHYCSLATFLNILNNKSIWLSDISKSNDKQELSWLKNRYESFLHNQWINYAKAKKEINDLQSVDFKSFDRTHLSSKVLLKSNIKISYVFCMSECRDDLGQWRGYADDGKGIAIGFNTKEFYKMLNIYRSEKDDFNFNFCKVDYGEKSADNLFSRFSNAIDLNTNKSSKEVLSQLETACILTMELAPSIKNNGFKQEKEWRLIRNIDTRDILNGNPELLPRCFSDYSDILQIKGLSYSINNGNLVGHIEMVLPNIKDMISEVIIGPRCSATKDDVLMMLISNNIIKNEKESKIIISKSVSSYV